MEYGKPKSAVKNVVPKGPQFEKLVLDTMKRISEIVGATLGPGGQPILIERFENGVPASISKDGVSVFKAIGFANPVAHCIMETARDAALRTASEAGDGTTSASILAEAVVRRISEFCKRNPKVSPQKVVRQLEKHLKDFIEPKIKELSTKIDFSTQEGRQTLRAVAAISANGDEELADAVMECFDIVGDHGNVTITEQSGPSEYQIEKIEGYPMPIGYEESCGKFYSKFINDTGLQRTYMDNCYFVLYHGVITEPQTLIPMLNQVGYQWEDFVQKRHDVDVHNVVIAATGYSEQVLGFLAANFPSPQSINVFPLLAPKTPQHNGQLFFLEDLQAVTGATLFDPINRPLDSLSLEDLGPATNSFECHRYRSTVMGFADESLLIEHAANVQKMIENPDSELDRILSQERLGKVTGGIAKLKVIGPSSGELKEKRDRAEDAVCAVKGAIKSGCLPGGGWTLLKLCSDMGDTDDAVIKEVIAPALLEPVLRLLSNCGLNSEEIAETLFTINQSIQASGPAIVYNAAEHVHVDAFEKGILDSTPAVLEAIRNSFSIAALLGTSGGAIVFARDIELERQEASDTQEFLRNSKINEANERY